MVLPRGWYKEVGQTRWVLRMLDANQSEQKDSLIQLLKEQFVFGYVQLRRRKCLEVCTYSQPNCLCPGGNRGKMPGTSVLLVLSVCGNG